MEHHGEEGVGVADAVPGRHGHEAAFALESYLTLPSREQTTPQEYVEDLMQGTKKVHDMVVEGQRRRTEEAET